MENEFEFQFITDIMIEVKDNTDFVEEAILFQQEKNNIFFKGKVTKRLYVIENIEDGFKPKTFFDIEN